MLWFKAAPKMEDYSAPLAKTPVVTRLERSPCKRPLWLPETRHLCAHRTPAQAGSAGRRQGAECHHRVFRKETALKQGAALRGKVRTDKPQKPPDKTQSVGSADKRGLSAQGLHGHGASVLGCTAVGFLSSLCPGHQPPPHCHLLTPPFLLPRHRRLP